MGNRRSRTVHHHHTRVVRDSAAADRARAEANRLQLEITRQNNAHAQRMEQMRQDGERRRREMEADMEKKRQQHAQEMQRLQNLDKEKRRLERNQTVARVTDEIEQLKVKIAKDSEQLNQTEKSLSSCREQIAKRVKDINEYPTYKQKELVSFAAQIKLDDAKRAYERDDTSVSNAIEITGQHDSQVGEFLTLTQSLINAAMSTEADTNRLDAALGVFGSILNDECQDRMTISYYFPLQKLGRFVPALKREGFDLLDHLQCDSKKMFKKDILSICSTVPMDNKEDDDEKEQAAIEAAAPTDEPLEGEELCEKLMKDWGLEKYWPGIKEEGWDDCADWHEITDEDLQDMGVDKKPKRKKFLRCAKEWHTKQSKKAAAEEEDEDSDADYPNLRSQEKRMLERICLKPQITWQPLQEERATIVKADLLQLSPVFGVFFGRMHQAVNQAIELLNFKKELNATQRDAIKNNDNNMKALKAIEYRKNDIEIRRAWQVSNELLIYSSSNNAWCTGKIVSIDEDMEGEWLRVQYKTSEEEKELESGQPEYHEKQVQRYSDAIKPLKNASASDESDSKADNLQLEMAKKNENDNDDEANPIVSQCSALVVASVVKVNVTDSMIEEFTASKVTERGLTLAKSVQDASVRIFNSQGSIRQSVLLANMVLAHKPADVDKDARRAKLWGSIDAGIIQIFESALEMSKVSSQYFGFFLQLQAAFQYYVSCYKTNPDVSLTTSLQRVREKVRQFNAFKDKYASRIGELNKTALQCIGDCVKTQIGAENWEASRNSLESTRTNYLKLQKQYDEMVIKLDNRLDEMRNEIIPYQAEQSELECKRKLLNQNLTTNNTYLQQLTNTVNRLRNMDI